MCWVFGWFVWVFFANLINSGCILWGGHGRRRGVSAAGGVTHPLCAGETPHHFLGVLTGTETEQLPQPG